MNEENLEPEAAENADTARIEALTVELETLRAESSAELEALRTENTRQLEAFCSLARSLPGVVPELVGGANLGEVQTSLETAHEAFNRVAAAVPPVVGPGPGAGGGARSGYAVGEDQPAKLSSERGVNLIYQAIASGKSGNLAR